MQKSKPAFERGEELIFNDVVTGSRIHRGALCTVIAILEPTQHQKIPQYVVQFLDDGETKEDVQEIELRRP